MDDELLSFINSMHKPYEGVLYDIQKEALDEGIPIVPHEIARLLSFILALTKPKQILEIGTAVGFSASLMSKYLAEGGHIITIDRYEYMIDKAKENFKRMNIEDRVTLLEGDAGEIVKTLNGQFDLIFLDASKGQYINFLPDLVRLLKVGGVLIADDVLQHGDIIKPRLSVERRQRTIHTRLRDFLKAINDMDIFETCIVPVDDGITLSYKKKEAAYE